MHPYTFVCPLGVYIPPCPPYSASACFQRLLHVVGVVRGPLHVGHLPCMGVPPHMFTPQSFIDFPVHQYVLEISAYDMGNISLMLGVLGCFPICWRFGGISRWGVHMLILYILVVHCLMFLLQLWLLLLQLWWCLLGSHLFKSVTMAPSLTGLPAILDQCEVVQPPPLMLRGSGGVIGPASVPHQQPPSSMPLLT